MISKCKYCNYEAEVIKIGSWYSVRCKDIYYCGSILYCHKSTPAKTCNYPNKLIVGYDYWERVIQEVKEHMVIGLTHYPDGSHTRLFGIPVTVQWTKTSLTLLNLEM